MTNARVAPLVSSSSPTAPAMIVASPSGSPDTSSVTSNGAVSSVAVATPTVNITCFTGSEVVALTTTVLRTRVPTAGSVMVSTTN